MTGWIIFGVIGWVVAFMVMICKGGNNDRMEYPAEKGEASDDKPMNVMIRVYKKTDSWPDTEFDLVDFVSLELQRGVVVESSNRYPCKITAELEEI